MNHYFIITKFETRIMTHYFPFSNGGRAFPRHRPLEWGEWKILIDRVGDLKLRGLTEVGG